LQELITNSSDDYLVFACYWWTDRLFFLFSSRVSWKSKRFKNEYWSSSLKSTSESGIKQCLNHAVPGENCARWFVGRHFKGFLDRLDCHFQGFFVGHPQKQHERLSRCCFQHLSGCSTLCPNVNRHKIHRLNSIILILQVVHFCLVPHKSLWLALHSLRFMKFLSVCPQQFEFFLSSASWVYQCTPWATVLHTGRHHVARNRLSCSAHT
jgi:hypothetical protein